VVEDGNARRGWLPTPDESTHRITRPGRHRRILDSDEGSLVDKFKSFRAEEEWKQLKKWECKVGGCEQG
jgi:hypothetical protein